MSMSEIKAMRQVRARQLKVRAEIKAMAEELKVWKPAYDAITDAVRSTNPSVTEVRSYRAQKMQLVERRQFLKDQLVAHHQELLTLNAKLQAAA